jgi:hypothetical protein
MTHFNRIALVISLLSSISFGSLAAEPESIIEFSKPKKSPGFLGTTKYPPTDQEKQFFSRVTEAPAPIVWIGEQMPPPTGQKEDPKGAAAQKKRDEEDHRQAVAYTLASQAGKYVAWFAIVREASFNNQAQRTELLLEHKYSDDLTDAHLQVVSLYGAGDFRAILTGKPGHIPPLGLVRIYGVLSIGADGLPVIAVDYARVWDWGLFTFMDYGIDKSNPKWVALRHVTSEQIYSSRPNLEYYEQRLGKRE